MNRIKTILTVFSAIAMIAGIIISIWIMVAQTAVDPTMKDGYEIMAANPNLVNAIGSGIFESELLLILAIAACLIAWLIHTATNPKSGKSIFIGVIALAVITLVCVYGLGNDTANPKWMDADEQLSSGTVQWISGGIFATGGLILIAILSVVYLEVGKMFK